eukprot:TRINITY_DN16746_c0_g1_i2.p1 TRINITY_DN16746_c0_g1~~TRINITY_DN16746_c0_g1_i2.p1  ORF type:complete len:298 (+),score=48.02 TRINITY_DN16746_c0_g1_i2:137-1030(+)
MWRHVERLADAYGWPLLHSLILVQAVLKGFVAGGGVSGMIGTPIDFMFRARGIKASSLQVYTAAVCIPWSIKPLMGLLSDVFPLFGYHRLPYMVGGAAGGALACATIGFWPTMSLEALLLCLFAIFYQIAVSDLLSEAVYSRKIKELPTYGPDLVSFVWGGIGVGKLLAVAVVGVVIELLSPNRAYLIAFPFAASMLVVPAFNLFEEKQVKNTCVDRAAWEQDKPLFLVAILLGSGSLALSCMSLAGFGLIPKVIAATVLAVTVLSIFAFVLNPIIAKPFIMAPYSYRRVEQVPVEL